MNSSQNKKKLVVITSRFPFPLEKGDKLRAYYQIKELAIYYDVHLIDLQFFKKYYYPPVFVQGKHVSEIDKVTNKNDLRTHLYGLKM